jgi:hypothetical protein
LVSHAGCISVKYFMLLTAVFFMLANYNFAATAQTNYVEKKLIRCRFLFGVNKKNQTLKF